MLLRASDVLVGIIAGAVCSVIAALFEASILTLRFFSLGRVGGGVGSKLLLIAIVGAIVGGIVASRVGLAGIPADWLKRCEALPEWVGVGVE